MHLSADQFVVSVGLVEEEGVGGGASDGPWPAARHLCSSLGAHRGYGPLELLLSRRRGRHRRVCSAAAAALRVDGIVWPREMHLSDLHLRVSYVFDGTHFSAR